MTNQAKTTVGLLTLDPGDVVLYVGGYPSNFTVKTHIWLFFWHFLFDLFDTI